MTFRPLLALLLLSACAAEPVAQYAPVIDPKGVSHARYASDLAECQAIATQAEADYTKSQQEAAMQNLVVGALMGAAIGAAYGNQYVGPSAAYGAGAGLASTDTEIATGGPRRIVDRCLSSRGYTVLSDMGRG